MANVKIIKSKNQNMEEGMKQAKKDVIHVMSSWNMRDYSVHVVIQD